MIIAVSSWLSKCCLIMLLFVPATVVEGSGWLVIPNGVGGGLDEANLSGYLLAFPPYSTYISLDSGSLLGGLYISNSLGFLASYAPSLSYSERPVVFLQNSVKAYLLSHAHLDHVSGLIIGSANDVGVKPIIGMNTTITNVNSDLFNGKVWPNIPSFGTYEYVVLNGTNISSSNPFYPIPNTQFEAQAFPLNHAFPYQSTAFLIKDNSTANYILYFGDFGPDPIENNLVPDTQPNNKNLTQKVWENVASLIVQKVLTTVFMECSYDNSRSDSSLFGHLTPKWVNYELGVLNNLVLSSGGSGIAGLNIIVTHIKPVPSGEDITSLIKQELTSNNTYNVNYYFPTQGVPFHVADNGITDDTNPPQSISGATIGLIILGVVVLVAIVVIVAMILTRET